MNKNIIKVISMTLAVNGTAMILLNHTIPGLIVLSIATLGGMVATSKNVIGN